MTFREPSAKGARSPFSKKKHRGSSENEEPLTDGGNSTVQHEPTLARLKEVLTENSSLQHVMLDQAREVGALGAGQDSLRYLLEVLEHMQAATDLHSMPVAAESPQQGAQAKSLPSPAAVAAQIAALQEDIGFKDEQLSTLRQQLKIEQSRSRECTPLFQQLKALSQQLKQEKANSSHLGSELQDAQEQIHHRDNTIEELQARLAAFAGSPLLSSSHVTQEDCETLHFSTAATHDAPASPQQMVAYTGDSEDEQASLPDTADTPLLSSPQMPEEDNKAYPRLSDAAATQQQLVLYTGDSHDDVQASITTPAQTPLPSPRQAAEEACDAALRQSDADSDDAVGSQQQVVPYAGDSHDALDSLADTAETLLLSAMQVPKEDTETSLCLSSADANHSAISQQQVVAYTGDSQDALNNPADTAETSLLSAPQVPDEDIEASRRFSGANTDDAAASEQQIVAYTGILPEAQDSLAVSAEYSAEPSDKWMMAKHSELLAKMQHWREDALVLADQLKTCHSWTDELQLAEVACAEKHAQELAACEQQHAQKLAVCEQKHTQELAVCEQQRDSLARHLDQRLADRESEKSSFWAAQQESLTLGKQLQEKSLEAAQLEQALDDALAQVASLKQEVASFNQKLASRKLEVTGLEQELAGRKQEVAGLKQDVADCHRDQGELAAELEQQKTALEQASAELQQERAASQRLTDALQQSEKRISELEEKSIEQHARLLYAEKDAQRWALSAAGLADDMTNIQQPDVPENEGLGLIDVFEEAGMARLSQPRIVAYIGNSRGCHASLPGMNPPPRPPQGTQAPLRLRSGDTSKPAASQRHIIAYTGNNQHSLAAPTGTPLLSLPEIAKEDSEGPSRFSSADTNDAAAQQQLVAYTGHSQDAQDSLAAPAELPLLSSPQVAQRTSEPLRLTGADVTDAAASQLQIVAYTGDSQDAQAGLAAPAGDSLLSISPVPREDTAASLCLSGADAEDEAGSQQLMVACTGDGQDALAAPAVDPLSSSLEEATAPQLLAALSACRQELDETASEMRFWRSSADGLADDMVANLLQADDKLRQEQAASQQVRNALQQEKVASQKLTLALQQSEQRNDELEEQKGDLHARLMHAEKDAQRWALSAAGLADNMANIQQPQVPEYEAPDLINVFEDAGMARLSQPRIVAYIGNDSSRLASLAAPSVTHSLPPPQVAKPPLRFLIAGTGSAIVSQKQIMDRIRGSQDVDSSLADSPGTPHHSPLQVAKNAPLLLIGAASTDAEASQQQLVAYTGDSQDAQASSLDAPAETVLLSPAQVAKNNSEKGLRLSSADTGDATGSQQHMVAHTGKGQDAQASSLDAPAETVLLSPAQVAQAAKQVPLRLSSADTEGADASQQQMVAYVGDAQDSLAVSAKISAESSAKWLTPERSELLCKMQYYRENAIELVEELKTCHSEMHELQVARCSSAKKHAEDLAVCEKQRDSVAQHLNQRLADRESEKSSFWAAQQESLTLGKQLQEQSLEATQLEQALHDALAEVASLKQEVASLEQKLASRKLEMTGLKQEVAGHKQEVAGLKQDVADCHRDQGELAAELEQHVTAAETARLDALRWAAQKVTTLCAALREAFPSRQDASATSELPVQPNFSASDLLEVQVSRVECGIQRLSLQRLMGPAAAQPCPADNTPLPADPVTAALISAATPRPGPSAWGSPASEATWQFTPEGHRVRLADDYTTPQLLEQQSPTGASSPAEIFGSLAEIYGSPSEELIAAAGAGAFI